MHADALCARALAAPLLRVVQARMPLLRDEATQRRPHRGHVQIAAQPLRHSRQQVGPRNICTGQAPDFVCQQPVKVWLAAGPQVRVLIHYQAAALQLRAPQLPDRPQPSQQLVGRLCLGARPRVAFTRAPQRAILPQRPRKHRLHPQVKALAHFEVRRVAPRLESLPRGELPLQKQVPWVLHPGHRHVTYPRHPGRPTPQRHPRASQGHALRLPVRQRPRQGQGELLPSYVLLTERVRRFSEDRHPAPLLSIAREKGHLPTLLVPEIDVLELHEDTNRRSQLRHLRVRSDTLRCIRRHRPDVALHGAHRPVHEPRLHPQVLRQEHWRSFAQLQHGAQALELVIVERLRPHLRRLLWLVMVRTKGCNGFPRTPRQPPQLPRIVLVRPVLAPRVLLPAVHEQHGLLEPLRHRVCALSGLPSTALAVLLQPGVVRRVPGQVFHPAGHLPKALRVALVRLARLRLHVVRAVIIRAVHLLQNHRVFKLRQERFALPGELLRRRRALPWPALRRQILPSPCIGPSLPQTLITDRLDLRRVPSQHYVQPAKGNGPLPEPLQIFAQDLAHAIQHLADEDPTQHAELVQHRQPRMLQLPLQVPLPLAAAMQRSAVVHRHAENAVRGGRAKPQLKRGAARRRCQRTHTPHGLRALWPQPLRQHPPPGTNHGTHGARLARAGAPRHDHTCRLILRKERPACVPLPGFPNHDVVRKALPRVQVLSGHRVRSSVDPHRPPLGPERLEARHMLHAHRRLPGVTRRVDQVPLHRRQPGPRQRRANPNIGCRPRRPRGAQQLRRTSPAPV